MQRPNRYLERSGSMKRGLDPGDGDDAPDPKRPKVPALASVIVEALKVDSLQKLCSSLEPILRRVVSEEVERALAKLGPARLGGRSSPKRIEGPDGRSLQLHFRSRLSLPLFTGGKVEGEQGAAIHVVLLDANTGHVVTSGPEASAKLDVVVLEGDFNNEDDDDWTEEDFESHVVKEREGKRPLLTGDVQVSLKEGVGTLGELTFTDNSSWIRSRKFRLGMKIAAGFCDEIRVREAKTEAFTVKDHRGELYKKHYPPVLKDDVWRLEKIGKDGSFHKRLNKAGIYTVEDFLKLVVRDSQRLRNILGSGMSNKMWECLVEHSKTCVVIEKYYVYYSDDTRNIGAIFNNIYEFSGLIYGGQYYSAEFLTDSQKVFADTLVKKAYDNWMHVIEFDGTAPLNLKQSKKTTSHNDIPSASANYSVPYDQQAPLPHQHVTVPSEQSSVVTHSPVGGSVSTGYNGHQVHRYTNHPQSSASHPNIQFESPSFTPQGQLVGSSPQGQLVGSSHQTHITRSAPQGQLVGSSHQTHITRSDSTGLALGPPQQSSLSYQSMAHNIQTPSLHTYDDWSRQRDVRGVDEYFTEEEIRMRSHEMLENDDMQHLLRVLSTGGTANLHEDGYGFPSYMPSPFPDFNFDEDRSKTSGKAVVGWLKIKAAMRWGIFIRKKAAEKRAQLVELEESSQEY